MNSREKLINLINSVPRPDKKSKITAEQIADHLVANNVIVLPCKLGDTVWIVRKSSAEPFPARFDYDDIKGLGKTVFMTRAEAMKRMGRKR